MRLIIQQIIWLRTNLSTSILGAALQIFWCHSKGYENFFYSEMESSSAADVTSQSYVCSGILFQPELLCVLNGTRNVYVSGWCSYGCSEHCVAEYTVFSRRSNTGTFFFYWSNFGAFTFVTGLLESVISYCMTNEESAVEVSSCVVTGKNRPGSSFELCCSDVPMRVMQNNSVEFSWKILRKGWATTWILVPLESSIAP